MHIYAFGSVCRGDIAIDSDVDLLAVVDRYDGRLSPEMYSIYSCNRLRQIWTEGNPFAWHLFLESRLLFSSDGVDLLKSLGRPSIYLNGQSDCEKFLALFTGAESSLSWDDRSATFDVSTIFLAIRNIATCFSLAVLEKPDFSRNAALRLGECSLKIPEAPYSVLEKARILCTRGIGPSLSDEQISSVRTTFPEIRHWMEKLVNGARRHAARI